MDLYLAHPSRSSKHCTLFSPRAAIPLLGGPLISGVHYLPVARWLLGENPPMGHYMRRH